MRFLCSLLVTLFASVTSFASEVNTGRLQEALLYLQENADLFENQNYITLIDYSLPSTEERMFIIHLKDMSVEKYHVSHGRNSGLLYAESFSNQVNSNQSSLGFYKTGNVYYGKHDKSLNLHGLSETNSKAYERRIVIHGAYYASKEIVRMQGRLGRSLGCPAVGLEYASQIIDKLKEGSLIYAFN